MEETGQPYFIHRADNECLCAFAGLWTKTGNTVNFVILTKRGGRHYKECA